VDPTDESTSGPLRLNFDRHLKLEFYGSVITSDTGLLACRELDEAVSLIGVAAEALADARTKIAPQTRESGKCRLLCVRLGTDLAQPSLPVFKVEQPDGREGNQLIYAVSCYA
jgi:hypothetical protein